MLIDLVIGDLGVLQHKQVGHMVGELGVVAQQMELLIGAKQQGQAGTSQAAVLLGGHIDFT